MDNLEGDFKKESNKPRSLERSQPRRPNRFETLPPRLQKRQARRYENFDPSYNRGRGRGRGGGPGGYHGANNQLANKLSQGGKENLSDVANEEWETASESSDIAERHHRQDGQKDDMKKKDPKDKGFSSRKSFSGQRPSNDGSQGRKSGSETRRSNYNNYNSDRNRTRDNNFSRDNRNRDSGRGRLAGGSAGRYSNNSNIGSYDKKMNNAGNNPRPPANPAPTNNAAGRNGGRGNQPPSKPSSFPPKPESATAVYRVDEIKLQDPNSVQAALADLTNRKKMKSGEVAALGKTVKLDNKDKSNLEGFDLNNYASVVVIDDHPEVAEETNFFCDADDGFQEVTSKKRHKVVLEAEIKKAKREPRNKSGSRSRQNRLPPRLAKQRETNLLNLSKSVSDGPSWDVPADLSMNFRQGAHVLAAKDNSPAPAPPVNAWEKPITHTLQTQNLSICGQAIQTGVTSSSAVSSAVSASTTITSDVQALASSSKSSSFDRSDQHDSGIDVSDQPASAASSQRSSPSNDCKILTPKSAGKTPENASEMMANVDNCQKMGTVVFENKNFKAENAVLDKYGVQCKPQGKESSNEGLQSARQSEPNDEKSMRLPVTFSSKESYTKNEEGSDIKLDFTFDSNLDQLTDKTSSGSSGHITSKAIGSGMETSSRGVAVGVQSPISPSADELNLKIASVKKVWENAPPMPTVIEHPPTSTVQDDMPCQKTYGSFPTNSDPTSKPYSSSVDASAQIRKDDTVERSFRNSSPLQVCSSSGLVVKTPDHCISSVKSHVHVGQHNASAMAQCPGPISPPLVGGLDTSSMTGMRTITGIPSSVQMPAISAIQSPPTVLFNSTQQMAAQSGMYTQMQLDSRSSQAAVAAAMVQFSQSPHGYAALGTYGLSHQPTANAQLSRAYGQQNLFVQQHTAHQGQDIYSTNQFRVPQAYTQSQHVSSNQVLNAQQNLANSHLLNSQLAVQQRAAAGPSPAAAAHLQGIHGLQTVQPTAQTSYFSTSAQAQTATSFFHQPAANPGSPMQQQAAQFASHQGFNSQSALNVMPQATTNFRNFNTHQYKAAGTVMGSIIPESSLSLRTTSRSPEVTVSRNSFAVNTSTTTSINSGSVMTVSQLPGGAGKIGQQQNVTLTANRLNATAANKPSQYSLLQSQQHYIPFNQQKYGQSGAVRHPQVMFPAAAVVRGNQHQTQPMATNTVHYPTPIQRPGMHAGVSQAVPPSQSQQQQPQLQQPIAKIPSKPITNVMAQSGKLTSAQQAKLRAEAVQQTHMFFAQSKTGKGEEGLQTILPTEKNVQSSSPANLKTSDDKEETAGVSLESDKLEKDVAERPNTTE